MRDRPDHPVRTPSATRSVATGLTLLFAPDKRVQADDVANTRLLWLWLGLLGVCWGLAMTAVWAIGRGLFPRAVGTELPLLPVATLIAVMALTPLRRSLQAPAELWGGESSSRQSSIFGATICILTLCLLSLSPEHYEPRRLPSWLMWTRPQEEYRILLLMPMWGVWAMMTPGYFVKPSENASRLIRRFIKRQPVAATAIWMAVPLAGTLCYLSFLGWWVALPAACGFLSGSGGSAITCRAAGGVSRRTLLAGNFLTQMAFLLGYLIAKSQP